MPMLVQTDCAYADRLCLCVDQLLGCVSRLGLLLQSLLAVQGVDCTVSGLLARHEHGTKGWAHARSAVQLSDLHINKNVQIWG